MRISDWSSDVCSSDLIVKTGGEWVDSIQLEELVATAEGVAEASVIAVLDPKWGERPLAVIVAKADAIPNLEIINAPVERAIASGEITRYAKLDRFRLVDRKSTRLNSVTNAHLVCRLLLAKKKH